MPIFLEFKSESTYIPGFDPSDELSFQITVPLTTETKSRSDDTYPQSEELSDDVYVKLQLNFPNKYRKTS